MKQLITSTFKRIIFTFLLSAIILGCDKEKGKKEDEDPAPTFSISFIIVDSTSTNLLPFNLPENLVFDPEDFRAFSNHSDSIGYYTRNSQFGHIFWMREEFYKITHTPDYQKDSTFTFYPCFGHDCDTVTIYKTDFKYGLEDTLEIACHANKIIWEKDTIKNYHCTLIPIQKF